MVRASSSGMTYTASRVKIPFQCFQDVGVSRESVDANVLVDASCVEL